MTLKTWLSTSNISGGSGGGSCNHKSKMTAGISALRESPTQGCALPTVTCGRLKTRRSKNWKAKSIDDGLESVEQGDYGFLEYFSLRQFNSRDTSADSQLESSYGTWNPYEGSWTNSSDWTHYSPAQFYPGTLSRRDTASRKRTRKDRPQSLHQDGIRKCLFKSEDLRTSTPLSNGRSSVKDAALHHACKKHHNVEKRSSGSTTTISKRHSVLAKLRPEKWKALEGTLRRSRSRDDVLGSPKSNLMATSQPDLLLSHRTPGDHSDCGDGSVLSASSPPAPLSILPPTCRNAEANVSQTLPRRRRTSSDNKENTLLARGKRWLIGGTGIKENKSFSGSRGSSADVDTGKKEVYAKIAKKPFKENVRYESNKSEFRLRDKTSANVYSAPEKHPLERLRCRKPLSFYLLEDYLSPVKAPGGGGVELDEYLNKTPRMLFNECPQRPLPPTPGWDSPSLSPPPSLVSGISHHRDVPVALSPSIDGSLNFIDTPPTSVAKAAPAPPPSPVFSPSLLHAATEKRKSWQSAYGGVPSSHVVHSTPSSHSYCAYSGRNERRHSQILESSRSSTQSSTHCPSYSHSFNYSNLSRGHLSRPYVADSTLRSMENLHTPSGSYLTLDSSSSYSSRTLSHQPRRTNSNAKDRKRTKNGDIKYKSPGQQKEALQRLGRSGTTTVKNPVVAGRIRQNGLITNQKLPILSNNNGGVKGGNGTSTRINPSTTASTDNGRSVGGLESLDTLSNASRVSSGVLPILNNNNKGEILPLGSSGSESRASTPKNKNVFSEDTHSSPEDHKNSHQSMSPIEALRNYGSRLTNYEKREIDSYPDIWYLGLDASKIHGEEGAHLNGGFDDDNGSYNKVMHDHISYRYEILEVIGKGSFGQVIRAIDHKSGEQVAIKIIRNKKRFHHQALVEVKILDHLTKRDRDHHHNVIHMLDYFYFRNHLCITFELMGLNLYELIKKNNYQGFGLSIIKRFAFSLVQCMKLLTKENIIHCDLKPENVLLKERGGTSIRVIDFGSSCYAHQRVYTYIQSRFYRSPEVILGLPYGLSIDMWSLGCILAELYTGYPLFPGENEVEQLACIMEVMGMPPQHLLMTATRRRLFFDSKGSPRCVTNSKGKKRRPGSKDLASILKSHDSIFVNFISRCLEWDPASRLTPDQALRHEWLRSSSSPGLERKSLANGASVSRRPGGHVSAEDVVGDADGPGSNYRVYKNKKRDMSTNRASVGASRSTDGHHRSPVIITTTTGTGGGDGNKDDDEEAPTSSSANNDAGSEHSLDDSGTFLPPIL